MGTVAGDTRIICKGTQPDCKENSRISEVAATLRAPLRPPNHRCLLRMVRLRPSLLSVGKFPILVQTSLAKS